MRVYQILLVTLLVIAACKTKKNEIAEVPVPPQPSEPPKAVMDSVLLTYQRSPCFGMCPTFNLTVNKSGWAIYEGRNFTDMIGIYQSEWDAVTIERVMLIADSIGYFNMQDKYDNDKVTDLPTVSTALLRHGELKKVANRFKGPKELQKLYAALDTAIAHATWKPKRPE